MGQRDDGSRQVVRLGSELEPQGDWTRCGFTEVPPDCDCDGEPDDAQ